MSSSYPSNPDPLFDNSPTPRSKPVLSWLNWIVVTAVFVAGLYYFPPINDATRPLESPQWMKALGRFHFIALHLPVGAMFVALFMEVASWFNRRSAIHLKPTITFVLSISAWGALFAVFFGIFLARRGGLNSAEFYAHQALGIVMTIALLVSLFFKIVDDQSGKGGILYRLAFFASVGIMGIGAHFGGNMVHGSDYLLKYAPEQVAHQIEAFESRVLAVFEPKGRPAPEKVETPKPITPEIQPPAVQPMPEPTREAVPAPVLPAAPAPAPVPAPEAPAPTPPVAPASLPAPVAPAPSAGVSDPKQASVYTALIAPFLEAKCNECHNEEKTKGDLRLDTYENLVKGGSNGDTLVPKDTENSALIYTMVAPIDADEHMPPEKKPQPSAQEIALVRWWVAEGASKDLKVADAKFPADLQAFVDSQLAAVKVGSGGGALSFVVSAQAAAAQTPTQKAIDEVAKLGANLSPISTKSEQLRFTAVNIGEKFTDENLKLLLPVAPLVVELNLGKSSVSDASAAVLGKFIHAKLLHLENTKVGDAILPELQKLHNLENLNLHKTQVSDKLFEVLPQLKSLKTLYVWESLVTAEAAAKHVDAVPGLTINLGWDKSVKSKTAAPTPAVEPAAAPAVAAAQVAAVAVTPESKIYEAIVAPILSAKCVSCHGEERTRGRLKMNTLEALLKGGADGDTTLIPGNIEDSLMLARIHLPADDDEHMPPSKEPQITKAELSLLTWWVQNGAKADATVAATPKNAEVEDALKEFSKNVPVAAGSEAAAAPVEKALSEAEKKTIADSIARFTKINATLMQVSQDRQAYRFSVVNGAGLFTDQQALLLEPVANHVLWADFSRSKVTDKVAGTLAKLVNLERLHLEGTSVGDGVIDAISKLPNLQYLNLYGTQVSDAELLKLASLKKLQRLYLWQTKATRATAKKLESMVPGLKVNIGLSEEELQTAVKPAEAPKPMTPPPAAAPAKPAAPAPAAPAKPAAPAPATPAKPAAPAPAAPAKPAAPAPAAPAPAPVAPAPAVKPAGA